MSETGLSSIIPYRQTKPYKSPYNNIDKWNISPYRLHMTKRPDFEWDSSNDLINQEKHGVSFALAQLSFLDQKRIILQDLEHSDEEN